MEQIKFIYFQHTKSIQQYKKELLRNNAAIWFKKCVDLTAQLRNIYILLPMVIIQGILTPTNSCNLQSKSRIEFSVPDKTKTYEQYITYTYNTRNNGQSTSVGLLNKCK
jgi:hypothetical protein